MKHEPFALDLLASSLDGASQGGHLPNPALEIDSVADTNRANTKSYILAIRARLIELGYLWESSENRSKDYLDSGLKKAIARFQKDAGLKQDSWVGPKTWRTLQQLVSFEDEQDPAKWSETLLTDLSQPAILRAVYLRLYALGFFEWGQKLNQQTCLAINENPDFKDALRLFINTARSIGILKNKQPLTINLTTLRALFQQDELIRALNRNPDFVEKKRNRKFVSSVGRIELWMLGFDVSIGNPRYRFLKRKDRLLRQRVTHLKLALTDFWKQQPKKSRPLTKKKREMVTPDFFRQLIKFEKEDQTPDDFVGENLVRRINAFSDEERTELKSRLTNIAGSIWDGVKRVFRWIKRFFMKIVSTALNVIKNVARFIAKHARSVFGTVKKAFEIVYRGTVYLSNRLLPGSDARQIAIYHDRDFDACVFINQKAEMTAMQQLMNKNRKESICFGAACRILSHLATIISNVARTLAAGAAGWFVALLTLSKLAMRIRQIRLEVQRVESLEVELQASPFLNRVD